MLLIWQCAGRCFLVGCFCIVFACYYCCGFVSLMRLCDLVCGGWFVVVVACRFDVLNLDSWCCFVVIGLLFTAVCWAGGCGLLG